MITGDGNLVEVQASVRYRIVDLHTTAFQVNQVDEIVRAATESVLRGMIAARPFAELLTQERGAFQAAALAKIEERCTAYRLGIQLDGFSLHDLHPPQEVVLSYYEVTRAMELRDRLVNQAQADALRSVRNADAEKTSVVLRAQAAKEEAVRQAAATLATFD